MIGYLKGKVIDSTETSVILFCNGVGWSVQVGVADFLIDSEVELFIYTQFRETDLTLWGFKTSDELKMFKTLINVSGVGGKTAQSLINEVGISVIIQAVLNSEPNLLKVSGVGLRTAEKIIIELKGKIEKLNLTNTAKRERVEENENIMDAKQALVSLGYRPNDIDNAINTLDKVNLKNDSVENIVRKVLQVI